MKRLHHQNKQRNIKFRSFLNQRVTSYFHCRHNWDIITDTIVSGLHVKEREHIHQHVRKQ